LIMSEGWWTWPGSNRWPP